jgi:hypothetical protein
MNIVTPSARPLARHVPHRRVRGPSVSMALVAMVTRFRGIDNAAQTSTCWVPRPSLLAKGGEWVKSQGCHKTDPSSTLASQEWGTRAFTMAGRYAGAAHFRQHPAAQVTITARRINLRWLTAAALFVRYFS